MKASMPLLASEIKNLQVRYELRVRWLVWHGPTMNARGMDGPMHNCSLVFIWELSCIGINFRS